MAERPAATITGDECRAARMLLGWSRARLEEMTGAPGIRVSQRSIANFETSEKQASGRTIRDLRAALESASIEFIETKKGTAIRLTRGDK